MKVPVVSTPLSIIALFVAVIELFLAYPVTQLQGAERLILVVFMTAFPCYVASLFFFVLWYKPLHLYSPQDIPHKLQDRFQAKATEGKTSRVFDASPLNQPVVIANLKERVDAGDFEGAYRSIEEVSDEELRAKQYKELAKIFMARKDKPNSVRSLQEYHKLRGDTPDVHRFLAYAYWLFNDLDTAIVHAEKGLQLAVTEQDEEEIKPLRNSLAYYYAEKGQNKEQALRYAHESLSNTTPNDPSYPLRLDTYGYVHLKFASKPEEMDKAIDSFTSALKIAPGKEYTPEILKHLEQAVQKKQSLLSSAG